MKPNVDLTLNRDFAKRDRNGNIATAFGRIAADIQAILHGQHPRIPWLKSDWEEIESDDAFRSGESSQLIFMGNKEERAKKKFYNSEYDDTICYCCGSKIKTPWKNNYRVCERCNKASSEERIVWNR